MKNKFQFLTYAGFYIVTSEDFHILIDPYMDNNKNIHIKSDSFERIDLILVSHGPFDHVGDTAKLAIKHGCPVICPDDVMYLLMEDGVPQKQIIKMCWGLATEIGKIRVKAIENHHRSLIKLPSGHFVSSTPVCYIITLEDGTRIYNSGDTALFSDMKLQGELYRPHIGLINVSGRFCDGPGLCLRRNEPV
jgi:L-ascorbate metabolism protein UlaG (beta-lactamase superfamily)